VVLGGAGTIGRHVVRDLFESHSENLIAIADYNKDAAEKLAQSYNDSRITAHFIDARNQKDLITLLNGKTVAINCLQYTFNILVMKAALKARTHYLDLGGLFSWTKKQLKLNTAFEQAGLTAVIGMGCAPGITNVLAAYAVKQLKQVYSLKIRVGYKDFRQSDGELYFPYSVHTIIEELTLKPWIFCDGKFKQVRPRTGWELMDFSPPIGPIWTLRTRHSEIATLPLSFKNNGLRYCDFKVSFDKKFVAKVMDRLKSGWTIKDFQQLQLTNKPQLPNDYEISRVIADDLTIDCHAKAKPGWGASAGDIDTACPPSIVAQMIMDGSIKKSGVFPPETIVPIAQFFRELEKRGMTIKTIRP